MKILTIEDDMIHLVNNERIARGLKHLKASPLLCQIARAHSKVQLNHNNIFHKSPVDRSDHSERIEAGGYMSKSSAENVSTAPTLEIGHNGLMNSQGHYKNIVGDWEEIGVGIEKDDNGQLYVTQLFANPVKLINVNFFNQELLDKLFQLRRNNYLPPVKLFLSNQLQLMAEGKESNISRNAFNTVVKEIGGWETTISEAKLFQFAGYSNPHYSEQLKLALDPRLKGISLAFHQNTKNGTLKGVLLFLL